MNTSITKSRLKELVKEVMVEEADYQTFFKKALEKAGKGINDMNDDEKKTFFNKVDTAWNGKGEKNEGNAFGAAVSKAKQEGDDEFEVDGEEYKVESISTELPNATIPSAIKMKLSQAIDKIKDAKLSNVQKLQLVAQVIDSLGIDKSQLGTMASKIRSKMESTNEAKFKSPDYIISTTPASSLPAQKLSHADVMIGLKLAEKLKNYTLNVKHYKLVHANGKVALKLTPEGKTAVRVRTENDPKYLQLIQNAINDVVSDYVSKIKESVNEADGLWANIRAKQARGGKPAHGNSDAHKDAVAAGEKINKEESVSEGVSSADMDKIKGAVEAAKSFMNVGAELKKLGMKYTFATEPLAIYIIQPTPNNKVAIVNKKYVSKPDFVVGDIAVGVMEGKSVKN